MSCKIEVLEHLIVAFSDDLGVAASSQGDSGHRDMLHSGPILAARVCSCGKLAPAGCSRFEFVGLALVSEGEFACNVPPDVCFLLRLRQGEHVPETLEYNISSTVFRARRPFHPQVCGCHVTSTWSHRKMRLSSSTSSSRRARGA